MQMRMLTCCAACCTRKATHLASAILLTCAGLRPEGMEQV